MLRPIDIIRFSIVPLSAVLLAAFCGCGGSTPTAEPSAPPATPTTSGNTAPPMEANAASGGSSTAAAAGSQHRQNEVWTDADGRKYLGDVPFDAFFDEPFTVAGNTTPLNGGSAIATGSGDVASGTPMTVATTTTPDTGTTASESEGSSEAGSATWEEMLPLAVLDSEITDTRNFLKAALLNVGSYKTSMLMIPRKAAVLAVLSQIAQTHTGDISWKEDAAYVRNLAKKMNESNLQPIKKDQDRLLKLFENMNDTFNRSRPAGLEDPPAEDSFVDTAEMRFVMMRMEDAEKKMKTEAGSESAFGSKKDMINHEASILQTLTHVIALEEYGYTPDEEFSGYANKIIEAAKEIKNATDSNDFSSYELALSKISTACQECHSAFKNN